MRVKGMDDDAAGFEAFARAHLSGLLRTGTAICGDPALAEDLVQEVLIKVMRHWRRISKLDNPPAYVRRMLVNEFISDRRKTRSSPRANVEPTDVVLDHAERIAERDSLRDAIRQLPRQQQAALALRYFIGLSDPEIADHLGCRPGTVRGYLSRALATLRIEANHQSAEPHESNLPSTGGVRS